MTSQLNLVKYLQSSLTRLDAQWLSFDKGAQKCLP